jgi:glucokinase
MPPRARRGATTTDLVLGIDIGATKVIAALVDRRGRVVVESDRRVHRNDGPAGVARAVLAGVADCRPAEHGGVLSAGVAVAAQVDTDRGVVLYAPNLRWRNVALADRLRRTLDVPVLLENDVRAATWGEWYDGAGRGCANLACLFVGTGVGGGFVVDGRLLSGAAHATGEVGHLIVETGGRRCHCPGRGCLEAYASGWAIGELAREAIRSDPDGGAELVRRAGGIGRVTATTVTSGARDGDRLARRLMDDAGEYLGAGAVSVVNAFNPARLLLGGGVVEGWPDLVRRVASAVRAGAQPPAARSVVVGRTRLGPHAPVVGVARLARARVRRAGRRRAGPR